MDSTDTPTAPENPVDKVALARRLLEAHDALQAARACEPPSDDEGDGLPLDPQAWLSWKASASDPAYADWKAAMDAFREVVPHHGIGSGTHPLTFRIECEAIITEDPRAEPLARALHPGEWWNSPNPLYAMDKDAHIAQARRMLAVIDAADAAAGFHRVPANYHRVGLRNAWDAGYYACREGQQHRNPFRDGVS